MGQEESVATIIISEIGQRNDMTERTVPINVRDQISSANQPQYWGMIPSDPEPVAFARESVQAVYIPMGKTLLHEEGS